MLRYQTKSLLVTIAVISLILFAVAKWIEPSRPLPERVLQHAVESFNRLDSSIPQHQVVEFLGLSRYRPFLKTHCHNFHGYDTRSSCYFLDERCELTIYWDVGGSVNCELKTPKQPLGRTKRLKPEQPQVSGNIPETDFLGWPN